MNCIISNFDYHTPVEWQYNNKQEIITVEKQQEITQRLTLKADRLIDQAEKAVVKNKLEIDHQSKVKVKDVEFKCKEIEIEKNDLDEEIGLLSSFQKRIENAKNRFFSDALNIIDKCLKYRKCRPSVDLVFDDVEKELLKERELILGIEDELEDLLDKVVVQIRKLRSLFYDLSMDLSYKQNTQEIEQHNENLNENSTEISILTDKNLLTPAVISIQEWDRFTPDLISIANKTIVEGRPIRMFLDNFFSKIVEEINVQSSAVKRAIESRIEEYNEIIEKLNKQRVNDIVEFFKYIFDLPFLKPEEVENTFVFDLMLCDNSNNSKFLKQLATYLMDNYTVENVGEIQKTIDKLEKAKYDKETYIALVHTRLLNRTRRTGIELCRDNLEVKLHDEMTELEGNMESLQKMIADSAVHQRRLRQSISRIDIQLEAKKRSLCIENEKCFNADILPLPNYNFYTMDESADAKEDENKKIIHTYPLVRVCDMSEEMKAETIEVIITACEKFGSDLFAASKAIKQVMDKKYGPPWNVVVGEAFGIQITYQVHTCMHMFYGGNLGICVWKIM